MRIVFLWALLGIGLFSACKRKAQLLAQATTPEQKTDSLCRPSKETVLQAVLLPDSLVQKLTPRYQYCEGKFKCVFQNKDQRLPFTLHFKTTRGQQTTFTLTAAFGLPVAAGWVRADSLYFHNKLDGSRIKEPLDLVYQYTGLPPDLGLLEGVLSGQYSMPRGFVATQVQDTMLVAYPLPNQTYRLQYQYAYKALWPKYIELKDDAGLYYIKNSAASNGALPEHTLLVQQDSTGKPLTQLKMDVLNRKFE